MKPPCVAIIADDLTGALDACAPFARRGLHCLVAVTQAGLDDILHQAADVVCINTASRELAADTARIRVADMAARVAARRPGIAFKKIDSRLKGHVLAEIRACQAAFGRSQVLVAPAIPAQGRFVRHGEILGKGVAEPIDIAARLGNAFLVGDGSTDQEMQQLAARHYRDDLLVGASGLSEGLAQTLTEKPPAPLLPVPLPMLIAIGSHDPVTMRQIERLRTLPGLRVHETTDGAIAVDLNTTGTMLVRAASEPSRIDHGQVLHRFGLAVADQLRNGHFASVLLCGGETAQTVLDALGIASVDLLGEALPGIPVSQAQLAGHALTILTKSGGFGTADDLFRIAEAARPANPGSYATERPA